MVRLCHVSDTHGRLEPLRGSFDAVVSSGDFLPNRTFGTAVIEQSFQPCWIEDNADKLRTWIGDKPLLMTSGNHDFVSASYFLRQIGINAVNLDDHRVEFEGLIFYGFPWVPHFTGQWNYESDSRELEARTNAIDLEGVDVLVAHSPLYGVRDMNRDGERCGSRPMRNLLQEASHVPTHYLCGHIHESAGIQAWSRGITVSNAACTQHILTLT